MNELREALRFMRPAAILYLQIFHQDATISRLLSVEGSSADAEV